jgi:hypothetical protein
MADYRKIVEEALKRAKKEKTINESIVYPDSITERMHPSLEEDLKNRQHSLGKHPIFPEDDESTFEEKIIGERFKEVANRYKRAYDVESVNMGEDIVEIRAELTSEINMEGTKKNPKPITTETEFKNHDEMVNAKDEVYKRRFLNAMIQGAAKKTNHMFHVVDEELTDMDPRLPNKYSKMMAAADYIYYIVPAMEKGISGGIVRVQFPTASNPKAVIYAQAMVFPVLIHELVKGVMELMSAHGLPKDKRIGEYVINKSDFLAAEPWDMRLGPALWGRFTSMIEPDDFHLKHHLYTELASMPVKEFNLKMREIMAGTKEGKKIVKNILDEIKTEFKEDEFNEAMNELGNTDEPKFENKSSYRFDELFGDDIESDDTKEGYDFDELF